MLVDLLLYGILVFLVGLFTGYVVFSPQEKNEKLKNEIRDLKVRLDDELRILDLGPAPDGIYDIVIFEFSPSGQVLSIQARGPYPEHHCLKSYDAWKGLHQAFLQEGFRRQKKTFEKRGQVLSWR